ncbi:universal stress protein [uncultured Jatrophihabitans sp.]|uniref:universal stress protein n=1 Tax=uncultured Jatrophihabitans sp. TaxID=1610747 RepID=UPI0035CB72F7
MPQGSKTVETDALLSELDMLRHDVSAGDIVVGAAYGISGYQAVRWATHIAQARGRRLQIVRVVREVEWLLDPRPLEELIAAGDRLGRNVLTDYAGIARSVASEVEIRTRLLRGSIYTELVRETAAAGLLVVGAGDDCQPVVAGDRAPRPVADWFTEHAPCPVLVVDRHGHNARDDNCAHTEDSIARYGEG